MKKEYKKMIKEITPLWVKISTAIYLIFNIIVLIPYFVDKGYIINRLTYAIFVFFSVVVYMIVVIIILASLKLLGKLPKD